ncbi:MAG TPA: pyridoxal-dependent decarboxylase [Thermoanaerobaculia bacterium]|jgi:aromatic-L-amino-acid decarboxylase
MNGYREHAHRMVDWVAEYLEKGDEVRVPKGIDLAVSPPTHAEPLEAIRQEFVTRVIPQVARWSHPSWFDATSDVETEIEVVVVDWLRQMLALPETFSGLLFDGAPTATFHALAAARQLADPTAREAGLVGRPRPLKIYATEMTHATVAKAAAALGLGLAAVHTVPLDDETLGMNTEALREAIHDDWRNGATPACVVATAGSALCTSIDPLEAIADICESEGVWLHVDGEHGGTLGLLPEKRRLLKGWQRADSIVITPQDWTWGPLDASVLLTRRGDILDAAFSLLPDYLRPIAARPAQEFADLGLPLGRRLRAVKLWYAIRSLGVDGIADRMREPIRIAASFAARVDVSERFERVTAVPLTTVCFRAPRPEDEDGFNERLVAAVNATGEVFLTSIRLRNRAAIRLTVTSVRTTERHVARAWEILNECYDMLE